MAGLRTWPGHPAGDPLRHGPAYTSETSMTASRCAVKRCVGGALFGAAGLLQGVHVADDNGVTIDHGQIKVPGRVVVDGRFVSAGNTASIIDLALWVAAQYVDPADARAIQVGMEYDLNDWGPPFEPRPAQPVTAEERQRFVGLVMHGSRGQLATELGVS